MIIPSVILLIGIFTNSIRAQGSTTGSPTLNLIEAIPEPPASSSSRHVRSTGSPCLNLTEAVPELRDLDVCLHTSLQNGHTIVDGTYECDAAASYTTYGCQNIPPAPRISVGPVGAFNIYALGTSITLTCVTDIETVTDYIWYRSDVIINGENGRNLTISNDLPNGTDYEWIRYRCRYVFDQRNSLSSPTSNLAALRVEDIRWNVTPLRVLTGVPDEVIDGLLLELTCLNYVQDSQFQVRWDLNGVPFATIANSNVYRDFKVNSTTAGGTLRCTFFWDIVVLNDPEAEDVIPNLPVDNYLPELYVSLVGRHHSSGDSVEMTCVFNNSAFTERALSQLPVALSYAWSVNGSTLPVYTTRKIEVSPVNRALHHGDWACSAQLGSNIPKLSRPVYLFVDGAMDTQMSTVPALPIMGGTLFILCAYDYFYLEVSSVEYTWSFNDTTMYGYDADFLYISSVDENVVGVYTCTVSIEKRRSAKQTFTVGSPVSIAGMPTPSLIAVGFDPNGDLHSGSYPLRCLYDIRYATFGMNITVFKDGENFYPDYPEDEESVDPNAYDGTFDFLVHSNVNDFSYSCRVELGDAQSETSNIITLSFLAIDYITIYDEYGNQVTTVHRFIGDQLRLTCVATLLPGATGFIAYNWFSEGGSHQGAVLVDTVTGELSQSFTCGVDLLAQSSSTFVNVFGHENQAPTLTISGQPEDGWLLYNETYELFCDTGYIIEIPGMLVEISESDNVVYTGSDPTYTIPSDVNSKNYSCRAVGVQNTSSSNNVIAQFRTIDSVEIQTSEGELAPSVIYADSGSTVNLICGLTLSSGVPAHVTAIYNWYDLDQTSHGSSSEIEAEVTSGSKTTFKCSVKVGDYLAISTNNVKVQCSSCFCSFWKKRSERMRVR